MWRTAVSLALILAAWALLAWPDHRSAIAGVQLVVALLAVLWPWPETATYAFWGGLESAFLLGATAATAVSIPILQADDANGIGIFFFLLVVALLLNLLRM